MTLSDRDVVASKSKTAIVVACADLRVLRIPQGVHAVKCNASPLASLTSPDDPRAILTRASGPTPRVLAPRATKILDQHPMLRWTPIIGASVYTVSVRGLDLTWKTDVAVPNTRYPESAPPLERGMSYKVDVSGNGRSSGDSGALTPAFDVLSDKDAAAVRMLLAKLQPAQLSDAESAIATAAVNEQFGLFAEALDALGYWSGGSVAAPVALMVGRLLESMRLGDEAGVAYQLAVSKASTIGANEVAARAHEALARLYRALGRTADAAGERKAAVVAYQRLGALEKVAELTK